MEELPRGESLEPDDLVYGCGRGTGTQIYHKELRFVGKSLELLPEKQHSVGVLSEKSSNVVDTGCANKKVEEEAFGCVGWPPLAWD